jgi:hypothetical protein
MVLLAFYVRFLGLELDTQSAVPGALHLRKKSKRPHLRRTCIIAGEEGRPVDGVPASEPAVEITILPSGAEDLPSTAGEPRHQVVSTVPHTYLLPVRS